MYEDEKVLSGWLYRMSRAPSRTPPMEEPILFHTAETNRSPYRTDVSSLRDETADEVFGEDLPW